jgi:uncharacterized protein (TIGR00369 family)
MQQPNDDYINKLMEMVNTSPYPRHLRMQLVSISMDQSTVKLKTEQCHLQPFGIVHGGVFATLIDTATFWSVFLRLPEDAGLVNIDLKLNYLKSVSTGMMTAEGRCIRAGRSINYAEASVRDKKGNILAHGTSTLMVLPGKGIEVGAKKFLDP